MIFFTGVAGAVDSSLKQWDVVVADEVIQYDMDARPLFKRFYIPALNVDKLSSNKYHLFESLIRKIAKPNQS